MNKLSCLSEELKKPFYFIFLNHQTLTFEPSIIYLFTHSSFSGYALTKMSAIMSSLVAGLKSPVAEVTNHSNEVPILICAGGRLDPKDKCRRRSAGAATSLGLVRKFYGCCRRSSISMQRRMKYHNENYGYYVKGACAQV